MNKDRLKLISLFIFFLLSVSLITKLYNNEMEHKKREAEYLRLISESRKAIMEATVEKKKAEEELLKNDHYLREELRKQEEIIKLQQEELTELKEFRNILETVKKFSGRNMKEREVRITALSLYRAQSETRIDWRVLAALIMTESSYRADIVSEDPSYGLMQLMLPTVNHMASKTGSRQLTERELLSIEKNIELGSKYLLSQVIKFSSLPEGIMAYNFGPGRLAQLKREKKQSFESVYLKKIRRYHREIDNFLDGELYSMN